jgi:hypothetical protein
LQFCDNLHHSDFVIGGKEEERELDEKQVKETLKIMLQ